MKKITALILFLIILTACAATDTKIDKEILPTTETTIEPAVNYISDSLPAKDLDGYTFRILTFENALRTFNCGIYVDTMNGGVVNDAVYEKIISVEERFNCNIVLADATPDQGIDLTLQYNTIKNLVLSGEDAFDICTAHDIRMADLSLEGFFMNVYDIPYLDFDKPWWPSYTVEAMSVGKQMYLISNMISYLSLTYTRVMYFNKNMMNDIGQELPYNDVYNGNWTLDKLYSIVKNVYNDINGDGKHDEEDLYGYANPGYYYCVPEAFNIEPYKKTADGKVYYDLDIERFSVVIDKLYNVFFNDGSYNSSNDQTIHKMFTENRIMFIYGRCSDATNYYTHSDVKYGISPMPKLDESQAEFYGGCNDRPCAVPVTVKKENLDKIGIIIEAMSAEGYRKVFPAYFEIALKVRYADQTEDADMFDIVRKNVILSFNYMYGGNTSPYLTIFTTLFNISNPSKDLASWAAKNESVQVARVELINNIFEELRTK
ncbi:MAG: hypothetical protein FWF15_09300 [Oscillospiraceae bacterium]|nr:hypothetical protein [Oscillospiraceae bacterium]